MSRRKKYTAEMKVKIVREHLENQVSISELSERFGVHPNMIHKWKKDLFEENGIIRTKWNKLMVLSGLLSAGDKKLTDQGKERIIKSTDLQIDIHTFGNRIDFAKAYRIHLVQKGTIIEPEKISANHVTYLPEKRVVTSGFPKYRATVRTYFPYDKISLNEKAEIVLVKNKKKVVFEVDFSKYK